MIEENILISSLVIINLFAFFLVAQDKRKSVNRGGETERTPEGILFFMASCFGSLGVYAGMFIFRHKTRKWYFVIGIPLLIIQNIATLYLLRVSLWDMVTGLL